MTDLERTRLTLAAAQLTMQIGSDDDFDRLIAAQIEALHAARRENMRQLAIIEDQLRQSEMSVCH